MTVGLAMAWPGMPAGKVEQLHGDGLLDVRQKIISNVLDDPADDPCSPFDHIIAKPDIGRHNPVTVRCAQNVRGRGHDQLVGLASTNDSDS